MSRQSNNNIAHMVLKMDFVAPPSIDPNKLPPYLEIGNNQLVLIHPNNHTFNLYNGTMREARKIVNTNNTVFVPKKIRDWNKKEQCYIDKQKPKKNVPPPINCQTDPFKTCCTYQEDLAITNRVMEAFDFGSCVFRSFNPMKFWQLGCTPCDSVNEYNYTIKAEATQDYIEKVTWLLDKQYEKFNIRRYLGDYLKADNNSRENYMEHEWSKTSKIPEVFQSRFYP